MGENKITNLDRLLCFVLGIIGSIVYSFLFSVKQEPVVVPEPKVIEQPRSNQEQDKALLPLDPKALAEIIPKTLPPELQAILNRQSFEFTGKRYQDENGVVYQVMHDNYKFYRGFFFKPTTAAVPIWQPVENLPWQVSADAAQSDLDKMAELEHWKPMESDVMAQRNLRLEPETLN